MPLTLARELKFPMRHLLSDLACPFFHLADAQVDVMHSLPLTDFPLRNDFDAAY
jgi:hypothetical protein